MAIPFLKFMVTGQGWPVGNPSRLIPAGTVVDTSLPAWAALAGMAPIDAIMLDQQTYDWATSSNGVIGLGYDVARVIAGPGVVSAALDQSDGVDWWSKPSHKEPQR
jgi:hypothetical protein